MDTCFKKWGHKLYYNKRINKYISKKFLGNVEKLVNIQTVQKTMVNKAR